MEIAQVLAGFSLGQADNLRRAMGKKKKSELDKQYAGFQAGHARARVLPEGHHDAVGHPAAVLRLRVQQGALGGLRRHLVLDGLPQGQLPGRVHGRAADQHPRRQGQVGDLPQRVPPHGHQGAAARRQRVGLELRLGRRRHPLRPRRDPQHRRERRRRHRRGPHERGPLHRLQRLPRQGAHPRVQQAGPRLADQGRRLRLPGPPPSRADDGRRRGASTCTSTSSGKPRSARTRCSAASTTRSPAARSTSPTPCRSGRRPSCWPSSATCSACTSPTTRCRASSTCCAPAATARSASC